MFMASNQWKNIEYHDSGRHYFAVPWLTVLQECGVPSFIHMSVLLWPTLTCSVCSQEYQQCTCYSESQFDSESEKSARNFRVHLSHSLCLRICHHSHHHHLKNHTHSWSQKSPLGRPKQGVGDQWKLLSSPCHQNLLLCCHPRTSAFCNICWCWPWFSGWRSGSQEWPCSLQDYRVEAQGEVVNTTCKTKQGLHAALWEAVLPTHLRAVTQRRVVGPH